MISHAINWLKNLQEVFSHSSKGCKKEKGLGLKSESKPQVSSGSLHLVSLLLWLHQGIAATWLEVWIKSQSRKLLRLKSWVTPSNGKKLISRHKSKFKAANATQLSVTIRNCIFSVDVSNSTVRDNLESAPTKFWSMIWRKATSKSWKQKVFQSDPGRTTQPLCTRALWLCMEARLRTGWWARTC